MIKEGHRPWSQEELSRLREHYPKHGASWGGWGRLLPGRTECAVRRMASKQGLRHGRYWTAGEDAALRAHYPSKPKGWPGWGWLLPGKTRKQMNSRAALLGIKCPRGEGWTDAQRRDLVLSVRGVSMRTGHTFLGCVNELNNLRKRSDKA